MENKSHALWAGFFTIAMLCATILAGIWLNRDKTVRTDYFIVTDRPISGLNSQAVVRYKGVAVGRVDDVTFDPHVAGQIDIKISIDPSTPITKSTFATLGYQGVTGIAFVQLDDDGTNLAKVTEGAQIPLRSGFLEKLESSGSVILGNVESVTKSLAELLTPENQKIIMDAFTGTTQATTRWASVANDLKPTLQRMPELAKQTEKTMASIQELTNNATYLGMQISELTGQLQDPNGPFNQTLTSYGDLSDNVQATTLPQIRALTSEISQTVRTLNKTLEDINERPQELLFGKPTATPGPGEPGFVNSR